MRMIHQALSVLCVLLCVSCATTGTSRNDAMTAPREIQSLDGTWKFFPALEEIETSHAFLGAGLARAAGTPADAEPNHGWIEPTFDDSQWWDIAVPGSWNTQFEDLWSYEGAGWYRRSVVIPERWRGKQVEFVCDGANYKTVVYVNGHRAGDHEGGYTQFSIAIDAHLLFGVPNVIAVAVENRSTLVRVPMERHDWWNHGGLYRPVRLVAMDRDRIVSAAVETDALSDPPTVRVSANVARESSLSGGLAVTATLVSTDGTIASRTSSSIASGNAAQALTLELPAPAAHLWSPESPYLYDLRLELRRGAALVDAWCAKTGIRTVELSEDQLLLNGKPYLLKGVNRYENYPDTGMTSTPKGLRDDIALMKGLGANAVRCHYPNSPMTYDMYDALGLFTICEVPLYQWGRPGHSEANLEAAKSQLTEMIQNLRNHPSVIMWSVSNENRIRPREEGEEHARLSQMVAAGNKELVALAHTLDPTRPVIEPSNRWPEDEVFEVTDAHAVNVYLGVPEPHVDALPAMKSAIREKFQELRNVHPGKPILVSEFGNWALRGLHTDYFPSEEYQAALLKTYWEAFMEEPDFIGGFVWVFADSDVHRKFTTIYEMRCAYGLYDIERRPKAAAETMRTLWNAGTF